MRTERCVSDAGATVGEWFALWADDVYLYVARRVGPDLASDVVAETFRVAVESYDRFDPARGAPRSWLLGIATNLIRQHWRAERRRIQSLSQLESQRAIPEDPSGQMVGRLDAQRRLRSFKQALAELHQDDLDVLVLTAWENMSSTEVGEVLGIPPGTVRSRLNRVRTTLASVDETRDN